MNKVNIKEAVVFPFFKKSFQKYIRTNNNNEAAFLAVIDVVPWIIIHCSVCYFDICLT